MRGLFVDDPEDFRIQPCLSPVWDTAINIIALAESGFPASTRPCKSAAQWLVDKEVRVRGDWTVNNPHPEASGWAFEYNNVYYPDTDDTAMVLMALRLVRPNEQRSSTHVFERALAWQLSFQCRDGGWAAFDKDVTQPLAGGHAVRRSQRHSRSDLQRSDRAHSGIARLHRLRSEATAGAPSAALSASRRRKTMARGMAAGA